MTIPPTVHHEDNIFQGSVTIGGDFTIPAGALDNDDLSSSAGIAYTKLVNARCIDRQLYGETATVGTSTGTVVLSELVHVVRGTSATIIGLDAMICTAIGSTAENITVDLQKTTSGSSVWASVCSAPVTFYSTGNNTIYTRYPATLASTATDCVTGDAFRIVATSVTPSTATQAKGLLACVTYAENPS